MRTSERYLLLLGLGFRVYYFQHKKEAPAALTVQRSALLKLLLNIELTRFEPFLEISRRSRDVQNRREEALENGLDLESVEGE